MIDTWLQNFLPGSSLLFFKEGSGKTPSWHCLNSRPSEETPVNFKVLSGTWALGVPLLFPRGSSSIRLQISGRSEEAALSRLVV